ncbi:DUF6993 domain-containing protein [Arthrobacter sp. NPDC093125]|uniref:DUF6993 domain-containing protein n=1 Tax=Arthrobacter sp. NPDC093125 TaxID=3363944 RepID=UPI00381E6B60
MTPPEASPTSKAVPDAGSSRGSARFRTGRISLGVVAAGLLLAGLAACSSGASPEPGAGASANAGQERSTGAVSSAAAVQSGTPPGAAALTAGATPSAAAGGPLATAQRKMTDALGAVVSGTPKPGTEQITQALTAAGFPAATLEVSASRTPTGLDVDSVEAAAVQGRECVIGQIRDGKVTVTVLPVLASGKCFVGAAG